MGLCGAGHDPKRLLWGKTNLDGISGQARPRHGPDEAEAEMSKSVYCYGEYVLPTDEARAAIELVIPASARHDLAAQLTTLAAEDAVMRMMTERYEEVSTGHMMRAAVLALAKECGGE